MPVRSLIGRFSWMWYERLLTRRWNELPYFEQASPDVQRYILARRLAETVHHFAARSDALPQWRELARQEDPLDVLAGWSTLPVMDKDTLRRRFDPHRIREQCRNRGHLDATGGSTGEPVRFFHDSEMIRAKRTALLYTRLRMGWKPGMPTVIVWGSERDIGRSRSLVRRIGSGLLGNCLIDGYRVDPARIDAGLKYVRAHRPVAMYGYSSLLETVAKRAAERGMRLPGCVRAAWNGGEMLYDRQVEAFRDAFGVPILNRYGGRELGIIACQFRAEAPLTILRPWIYVEIVDGRGQPAGPAQPGRILVTSTVCRGTPFIRYDVGDMAAFTNSDCSEAGIHALSRIEGRVSGLLALPDGTTINTIFWNHLFKEYPEVHQFQVVLQQAGDVSIRLVGPGFSRDRLAVASRTIGKFLQGVPFRIQWVPAIAATPQGKLMHVVRESTP